MAENNQEFQSTVNLWNATEQPLKNWVKKDNMLNIFVALETVIEKNTTVSSKIVSLADPDERLNLCCRRNPQKEKRTAELSQSNEVSEV